MHRDKINTAIARELSGFMWHIAMLATVTPPPVPRPEVYRLKLAGTKRPKPGRTRARVAAPAA
jgi:hypothetical protein